MRWFGILLALTGIFAIALGNRFDELGPVLLLDLRPFIDIMALHFSDSWPLILAGLLMAFVGATIAIIRTSMKELGLFFVLLGILVGIAAFLVEPRVSITILEHLPGVSGPIRMNFSALLLVLAGLAMLLGLWMLFSGMGGAEKVTTFGNLVSSLLRKLLLVWISIWAWFRAKIAASRGHKPPPEAESAEQEAEGSAGFAEQMSGQAKDLAKKAKGKMSEKLAEWNVSRNRD